MKDFVKRIKADVLVSALLCIVVGVVLLIWSAETLDIICKVLAAGLVIMGIVYMVIYLMNHFANLVMGVTGVIFLLVGVWIFLNPQQIIGIVPIVIGIILVIHGLQDFKLAWEAKGSGDSKWWIVLIVAVIGIAFGVLCIMNAFGVMNLAMKFIGAALVYDGLSDIWVVARVSSAARKRKAEEDALDVEYKEL